ncbi:hypothetical protein GCM10028792_28610 [Salinisphaera aquimarina]
MDLVVELAREALLIQSQRGGGVDKAVAVERILIREHIVVHIPEPALGGGRFGGFGGPLGVGMQPGIGQVPKNIADLARQMLLAYPPDACVRPLAIAALVIAVLQQGYAGVIRPVHMVACGIHRRA